MNDLRFAVKSLRRAPGFTLVAIVTLALGIGANTSMFSILDALLLRPLPYADTARLERIYRATAHNSRGGISPADYLDMKREESRYGEIAAYAVADMNVSEPGKPAEMVPGLRISANLFSTLGALPERGRGFRPDEEVPGRDHVLILSYRCWQSRFGGDAKVIGRAVRVDGETHEIVGVLPARLNDWRHLGAFDLFRPLALTREEASDRSSTSLRLVGRRSDALTRAQAEIVIGGFGRRLAAEHPDLHAGTTWRTLPIYDSAIPDNAKGVVGMLIGLSGFVLLIACSNLANLQLARTVARARELAVRSALGASRLRLLRELFAEALVLALAGGACAIQVAMWTHDWLNAFASYDPGDPMIFALDWRVLAWALGASVVTAVAFAVAPAHFALRLDLGRMIKSGARGSTAARGHQRFRQVLIAGQFALAMILLGGAGLFVRGLHEWNNRRLGWESEHLLTGAILLPARAYPGPGEVSDFHRVALERLEALPGVASASVSSSLPFFGLGESRKYVVAGREVPPPGQEPVAVVNAISPRYFDTVGVRVLDGRAFDDGDRLASPKVFVINRAMARGLFRGESPLGRRLARVGGKTLDWGEVVGVVDDVEPVASDRVVAPYQLYAPMAQDPLPGGQIAVRTTGVAPSTLLDGVRATMMSLDPDLPVRQLQPAAAAIGQARKYQSIIGSLLSMLALLGLALAALGVYGVIARAVAQRTAEFGIRLALGARGEDIARLVLTSGAKLAVIGSVLGLFGTFGVTRLVAAAFPGLHTGQTVVLGSVALLLLTVALVACYLPARHAGRISPIEALRAE